jgi:hypothetical protein
MEVRGKLHGPAALPPGEEHLSAIFVVIENNKRVHKTSISSKNLDFL